MGYTRVMPASQRLIKSTCDRNGVGIRTGSISRRAITTENTTLSDHSDRMPLTHIHTMQAGSNQHRQTRAHTRLDTLDLRHYTPTVNSNSEYSYGIRNAPHWSTSTQEQARITTYIQLAPEVGTGLCKDGRKPCRLTLAPRDVVTHLLHTCSSM